MEKQSNTTKVTPKKEEQQRKRTHLQDQPNRHTRRREKKSDVSFRPLLPSPLDSSPTSGCVCQCAYICAAEYRLWCGFLLCSFCSPFSCSSVVSAADSSRLLCQLSSLLPFACCGDVVLFPCSVVSCCVCLCCVFVCLLTVLCLSLSLCMNVVA